jgi:hypothetical protein
MHYEAISVVATDGGSRGLRLQDTTASTTLWQTGGGNSYWYSGAAGIAEGQGDGTGNNFITAAATHVVQAQVYDNGTTARRMGGFAICKVY